MSANVSAFILVVHIDIQPYRVLAHLPLYDICIPLLLQWIFFLSSKYPYLFISSIPEGAPNSFLFGPPRLLWRNHLNYVWDCFFSSFYSCAIFYIGFTVKTLCSELFEFIFFPREYFINFAWNQNYLFLLLFTFRVSSCVCSIFE